MTNINEKPAHPKRAHSTLTGEAVFDSEAQTRTATLKNRELRMFFQHINGIKSSSREWEEVIASLTREGVGIFGLAETDFPLDTNSHPYMHKHSQESHVSGEREESAPSI